MPTLILTARQTDDAQKLWRACVASDWQVVRVHGWNVPSVEDKQMAVYGEPLFARHVAASLKLRLAEPMDDFLPRLDWKWRRREVELVDLSAATEIRGRRFFKPAAEKSFPAATYESGAAIPAAGLPDSLPVLVQEIVSWSVEYRCFVAEGRVAGASAYCRDGELTIDQEGQWPSPEAEQQEAVAFCNELLATDTGLPRGVAVDVGRLANSEWAVVEANAAHSSGIYGCDAGAVLNCLLSACEREE